MYDVTRSGNVYKPKKAHAKTIGDVFRLFASTKRGKAAVPFAGLNLPGCFPLSGRVLLASLDKGLVEWPGLGQLAEAGV